MQGVEVDERDIRILEILEDNARLPWRRLAQMLGVSEATIYLRIRRLEKLGVLRGFTARIDSSALGLKSVMFVLLKVDPKSLASIVERMKEFPFVIEVHEVTGDFQLLAKIAAPTHGEAASAVEKLTTIDGVRDYSTIASLQTVRSDYRVTRLYRYWLEAREAAGGQ